jgi:hypothetical protein
MTCHLQAGYQDSRSFSVALYCQRGKDHGNNNQRVNIPADILY